MDFEEISIEIDAHGKVHIEVHGAKGVECLDLTRELEEALGGQVISRRMTPESLENAGEAIPETIQIKNQHKKL